VSGLKEDGGFCWGKNMIRLLIVDDHAMIRTAFKAALAKYADLNVIAEAGTGEEGVRLAKELKPDVVLMDVNLPGITGLEAASRIALQSPRSRLIAVTALEDSPFPRKFLEAGAAGFVTKACPLEELVQAIRTVAAGGKHISQHIAQAMALDAVNGKITSPFDCLTKRETEIVIGIVQGEDMTAIGGRLHVSAKTVASHKYNAFAKLGVDNDVALARLAIQHGLVEHDQRR
jgi:two-component system, NarL family, invasion response regulator UvrY